MSASDWSRVRELFERTLDLPEEERAGFVAREAGVDADLAAEVRRLLEFETPRADFLVSPPREEVARALELSTLPRPGERIGSYEIVRPLGAGSMGTVFEAHQERPARTVALKLMKFGAGAPRALRRFLSEGEILGRLRHPNIAMVFEVGVHEGDGSASVPFIAMELVAAARDLATYVREERLGLREILALVQEVCAAVQHAHRKGIIHRDLKPANILVDESGRPKVIDFGVARAVASEALDPATQTRGVPGTLPYMSPEELRRTDDGVDTRTDVYAIGVVLYELLTGRTPYETRERPIADVLRDICEAQVTPPSAVRAGLPEEMDWIVLKALEKEANQRYATPDDLARDLDRFLSLEPLQAGPPTKRYRIKKFVVRHRALVGASALALFGLLGGAVAAGLSFARTVEAHEETALQAQTAQRHLESLNAVVDTLWNMFESVSPDQGGRSVTLLELLEANRGRLSHNLGEDPVYGIVLRLLFARGYLQLGMRDAGLELLLEADQATRHLTQPLPAAQARVESHLGKLRSDAGQFQEGEERLLRAMKLHAQADELDELPAIWTRGILADHLFHQGRLEEAIRVLEEGLAAALANLGESDVLTLRLLSQLSVAYLDFGRHDAAQEHARRAHELALEIHGPDQAVTWEAEGHWLDVLQMSGRTEELVQRRRERVVSAQRIFGPRHEAVAYAMTMVIGACLAQFDYEQAEDACYVALEFIEANLGSNLLKNELHVRIELGQSLYGQGKYDSAWFVFEELGERLVQESLQDSHAAVLVALHRATLLVSDERFEEAIPEATGALELSRRVLTDKHWRTSWIRGVLGLALLRAQRYPEAERELERAWRDLKALDNVKAREQLPHLEPLLSEVRAKTGSAEPSE